MKEVDFPITVNGGGFSGYGVWIGWDVVLV